MVLRKEEKIDRLVRFCYYYIGLQIEVNNGVRRLYKRKEDRVFIRQTDERKIIMCNQPIELSAS